MHENLVTFIQSAICTNTEASAPLVLSLTICTSMINLRYPSISYMCLTISRESPGPIMVCMNVHKETPLSHTCTCSIPCYHNTIAMLLHCHGTQLQQILRKGKKIKFTLAVNKILIICWGASTQCTIYGGVWGGGGQVHSALSTVVYGGGGASTQCTIYGGVWGGGASTQCTIYGGVWGGGQVHSALSTVVYGGGGKYTVHYLRWCMGGGYVSTGVWYQDSCCTDGLNKDG